VQRDMQCLKALAVAAVRRVRNLGGQWRPRFSRTGYRSGVYSLVQTADPKLRYAPLNRM
jgi:hypothetical protein